MKLPQNLVLSSFFGFGVLLGMAASASAVSLPYVENFDVPPYVIDTPIAGQQGWFSKGTGNSPLAIITADPTGSGRGTLLKIGNEYNPGVRTAVGQSIDAPWSTGDLHVEYDIYGFNPEIFVTPSVFIGDSVNEWYAVAIEGMAGGYFRVNGSNAMQVPDIFLMEDTWYTVTVDIFWEAKTYNVTITDGFSTGSLANIPFWYDSAGYPVPANNMILFRNTDNFGVFDREQGYIDNLSITAVPEPSQVALMGMAAAFLALRLARRKGLLSLS